MKIITQIPAYLLAFVFIVLGSNHFLHFIPMPAAPPAGDVGAYMNVIVQHGVHDNRKSMRGSIWGIIVSAKNSFTGIDSHRSDNIQHPFV